MRRLMCVLGLIGALVAGVAGSAVAQDGGAEAVAGDKVTSQVSDLLSGYEFMPSKADWDKIGPAAIPVLKAIASDDAARASTRARAVSSLAYFPEADTQSFLAGLLGRAKAPALLRRKALRALAVGFGQAALPEIKPFLTDSDKRLRESAVRALGTVGTDEARALLKARLDAEPSDYIKETIEHALTGER